MSMTIRTILLAAAVILLLTFPAFGQIAPKGEEPQAAAVEQSETATAEQPEAAEAEKPKEEEPDFDELVKDLEVIEGLFTFYRDAKKGTVYMSIKPEQLDVIYLLSPTLEAGSGEAGMWGTMMYYERPIVFHKEPGNIQLITINTLFRADDPKLAAILKKMYSDSILKRVAIKAEQKDTGIILVDLKEMFAVDLLGLSPDNKYQFDAEDSTIGMLKAFPKNVNISATLYFTSETPPPSITLPDARSFRVEFRYDISERPNTGYKPRYADPRVGYFTTTFKDYGDDKNPERFRYYVQRWNLEKKYPDEPLSPPKEPIVFWLENTIPDQYKPAVRDGILMWNAAYERIGIKDAIEVRDMPPDADWDPADVRYHTIRWYAANDASFAIGPSRVDPFTGEIYDADISISIEMPWYTYFEYLVKIGLLDDTKPLLPKDGGFDAGVERRLGDIQMLSNIYSMNVLRARGLMEPGSKEEENYVYGYMRAITCHEVGHTLGLRHNFKGSRGIPYEKLQDASFTSVHGTVSSIMDYDVANIAPPGVKQGDYFSPCVGDYDNWAIEYGYTILNAPTMKDELPALEEIASRGAEPFHIYGTDEDAHTGAWSMDPECVSWDMGNDPFKYYEGTLKTTKELWKKLEDYWNKPGTDYKWFRSTYLSGFFEYWMAGRTIKRYIGGIVHNRYFVGDPNSTPPYVPTPGNVQRKAIDFMNKYIWSADAFQFNPDIVNKLGNDRLGGFDWNVFLGPHDFPIHADVLSTQSQTLQWIYDPVIMTRLLDMQYKYPKGVEPFYLEDMFVMVRNAIWDEVDKSININSFRRNLQRYQLDILIKLVVDPPNGTPDDARALARMDLVYIADAIDRALTKGKLDYITQAHLSEIEARIKATLDADVQYPPYNLVLVTKGEEEG